MKAFMPFLNEAQRRLYVASEAKALGRGGKRFIEKELGISHNTINQGIAELEISSSIPLYFSKICFGISNKGMFDCTSVFCRFVIIHTMIFKL